MKTAEEYLDDNLRPYALPFHEDAVIKAMKAYALAAIEEQLKVTAKETLRDIEEYLNLYRGRIEEEDILGTTRIELK